MIVLFNEKRGATRALTVTVKTTRPMGLSREILS